MTRVIPLVLSGGSGTRLWPLSIAAKPKQFLSLTSENSLLQETLLRLKGLGEQLSPPIAVCNEAHRFIVAEQLRDIDAGAGTIVLEPAGRNTAPAVAIAALLALRDSDRLGSNGADPLLLVLPADHVIRDAAAFVAAVSTAVKGAEAGFLVTFGIVPDRPETGYGYLLQGAPADAGGDWFLLERFVEKPDLATAQRYVDSGDYLWNSGMFLFSARKYLEELDLHAPGIALACRQAVATLVEDRDFARLGAEFLECPSDSIDYAVMEKTRRAAVVPLDAGWSDVGSWSALYEILDKDEDGNVLVGDVIALDCRNSYVLSNGRRVAAIGLEGHVVVETEDAVLVMPRDAAQAVKTVAEAAKRK